MNKKLFIPIALCSLIVVVVIMTCVGPKNKIKIEWEKVSVPTFNDSIELKVYVENSGSMDAYMCSGSNLKDAVFDYISDLEKYSTSDSLFYINSKIIPYNNGTLEAYIKDLTPQSFAKAGGDRSNTDLRNIFSMIMGAHENKTVSVLISDCILDIPQSATDYFGNCQVHIKNVFNNALLKYPYLGVEIIQLESKFDGFWFCGRNSKKLSGIKRPYYIWLIGDQRILAKLNKSVKVDNIIGGIKNYSAYASSQPIPFSFQKSTFKVNHTKKIKVELVTDLTASLQSSLVTKNLGNYKVSNPSQMTILSVQDINAADSKYSHVIEFEVTNPETMGEENVSFSYPYLDSWVEAANDSTGTIDNNIDKTTGILSLVKGVAEAYKDHTNYGTVSFSLKNK
ncbi:hypothetical protein L6472_03610 [Prevotella sp. E13-17]|uniref:hypothetical protein n=1 Tax=Prevotella sp. E13-17 TaxID=2913616 RepID=UPI001EDA80A7|nr:hypothetical protein [Prevotella sp. E13-17]UKK51685.1 hypothetical protein L6472_03610 [Prevotella sp. E13-17]